MSDGQRRRSGLEVAREVISTEAAALDGLLGQLDEGFEAAVAAHGDQAWILGVDEIVDRRLFGASLSHDAATRLGDVAIMARGRAAFFDPAAPTPRLQARHGSLTAAEMYVPLVVL